MHQRPPVEHAVVIRPEASGNSLGSSMEFLAEASFEKVTHRPNQLYRSAATLPSSVQ